MAIGDLPKIPHEYQPRLQQLKAKLGKGELDQADLLNHILVVLGRVRMDMNGIRIRGAFGETGLTADETNALVNTFMKMIDFTWRYRGREILIKKGLQFRKLRLGLRMKQRPATAAEVADTDLPIIEWELPEGGAPTDTLKKLGPIDSDGADAASSRQLPFKIHRLEALFGWMGDGWEEFARMLEIGLPALHLTQKATLDRIGKSFPAFLNAVLQRCGV
ncbi:MAG: hypothetical protein GY850_20755 [bacterium]|nr:hypothetical protein [bacterium]